ncbi:uncharacterized protein BX664DRAFT_316003 [Halteromyces radiatus]|uniref:uncharacterized protein n=1 Tax=Halteromyces radiatus TaxID=101107 RepID=UPI00221ECB38|nr:uncharacterized protein BX664DRAFT_316003 [Halteromyces radiatus]KAI8084449.1 hypothetical protein BX664DRAFT_316003 [Halteromyces radiatus]
MYDMKKIIFVLFLIIEFCCADTVLGGVVDFKPSCYIHGDIPASMLIEYNGVFNNETIRILEKEADPLGIYYHGETRLQYKTYKTAYTPEYTNNAISHEFRFANRRTNMVQISLRRGIKMIRFPFSRLGQRYGWYEGVQIRMTEDLVVKLGEKYRKDPANKWKSIPVGPPFAEPGSMVFPKYDVEYHGANGTISRNIDLNIRIPCLIAYGLIPYDRRTQDSQLINCMYLTDTGYRKDDPVTENSSYKASVEVDNCEHDTDNVAKLRPPPTSIEEKLFEYLKDLVLMGVSHIPFVGPFIAVGIDVAYEYVQNKPRMEELLEKAGVDASKASYEIIFDELLSVLKKGVRK